MVTIFCYIYTSKNGHAVFRQKKYNALDNHLGFLYHHYYDFMEYLYVFPNFQKRRTLKDGTVGDRPKNPDQCQRKHRFRPSSKDL